MFSIALENGVFTLGQVDVNINNEKQFDFRQDDEGKMACLKETTLQKHECQSDPYLK